jgi:regulation of enolase protein 1 (concanavalin A-like superfamily)
LLIQYNESYDNHTDGDRDGDGFDFDVNTSDSIMQYNYAHDNDGNGFQLNDWMVDDDTTGNVIRYNIAQNNGQQNSYAGLEVWGRVLNSSIYDNTVYVSPSSTGGSPAGIDIENRTIPTLYVSNLTFYNNIIVTTGGRPAINISSDELDGATGLSFKGNDYYSSGSTTSFIYGSHTYSSLSSWQSATGQEMLNGKSVGLQENPGLVGAGQGGTITDISALTTSLNDYKLQSTSPLINRGVNLASLGITSPPTDFFGNAVPVAGPLNIGADQQYVSSTASPAGNPPPWSSVDIGDVGKAGSASVTNSVFTVSGSGADIFGTADAFQYEYQTLNGDGQIIAQVSSLTAADIWSKAGVMIRDGNSAGAKQVSMLISANNKAEFERRWGTNGATGTTDVAAAAPEWVKLVRQGNTFTSYLSKDGKTWTEVGTTAVTMDSTVEIGLVVTSHSAGTLATATFNNVSVVT